MIRQRRSTVPATKNGGNFSAELHQLRGVAIIGVIAIHTFSYVKDVHGLTLLTVAVGILLSLAQYAVPLFLFISGVLFSFQWTRSWSWRPFLLGRVRRIIPPYLFWSVLYLLFGFVYLGSRPSLSGAIGMILTGSASRHLWYIPLILQGYCLLPLMAEVHRRLAGRRLVWVFLGGTAMVQVAWNLLVLGFDRQILSFVPPLLFRPLVSENILSRLSYLAFGLHVGVNWRQYLDFARSHRRRGLLLTSAAAASLLVAVPPLIGMAHAESWAHVRAGYFVLPTILDPVCRMLVFYALLLMVLAVGAKKSAGSTFATLGTHSFGIYLCHVVFLVPLADWLPRLGIGPSNGIFYPLLGFLTLAVSALLCGLGDRIGRQAGVMVRSAGDGGRGRSV